MQTRCFLLPWKGNCIARRYQKFCASQNERYLPLVFTSFLCRICEALNSLCFYPSDSFTKRKKCAHQLLCATKACFTYWNQGEQSTNWKALKTIPAIFRVSFSRYGPIVLVNTATHVHTYIVIRVPRDDRSAATCWSRKCLSMDIDGILTLILTRS